MTPEEKELTLEEQAKKASAPEFHETVAGFFVFNHGVLTATMKKIIFDKAKNRLSFNRGELDKLDPTKNLEAFKACNESQKLARLHEIVDAVATRNSTLMEKDQGNVKFLVNTTCERLYFPFVNDETRKTIKHEIEARGMGLMR
jgi:hypothetical protein